MQQPQPHPPTLAENQETILRLQFKLWKSAILNHLAKNTDIVNSKLSKVPQKHSQAILHFSQHVIFQYIHSQTQDISSLELLHKFCQICVDGIVLYKKCAQFLGKNPVDQFPQVLFTKLAPRISWDLIQTSLEKYLYYHFYIILFSLCSNKNNCKCILPTKDNVFYPLFLHLSSTPQLPGETTLCHYLCKIKYIKHTYTSQAFELQLEKNISNEFTVLLSISKIIQPFFSKKFDLIISNIFEEMVSPKEKVYDFSFPNIFFPKTLGEDDKCLNFEKRPRPSYPQTCFYDYSIESDSENDSDGENEPTQTKNFNFPCESPQYPCFFWLLNLNVFATPFIQQVLQTNSFQFSFKKMVEKYKTIYEKHLFSLAIQFPKSIPALQSCRLVFQCHQRLNKSPKLHLESIFTKTLYNRLYRPSTTVHQFFQVFQKCIPVSIWLDPSHSLLTQVVETCKPFFSQFQTEKPFEWWKTNQIRHFQSSGTNIVDLIALSLIQSTFIPIPISNPLSTPPAPFHKLSVPLEPLFLFPKTFPIIENALHFELQLATNNLEQIGVSFDSSLLPSVLVASLIRKSTDYFKKSKSSGSFDYLTRIDDSQWTRVLSKQKLFAKSLLTQNLSKMGHHNTPDTHTDLNHIPTCSNLPAFFQWVANSLPVPQFADYPNSFQVWTKWVDPNKILKSIFQLFSLCFFQIVHVASIFQSLAGSRAEQLFEIYCTDPQSGNDEATQYLFALETYLIELVEILDQYFSETHVLPLKCMLKDIANSKRFSNRFHAVSGTPIRTLIISHLFWPKCEPLPGGESFFRVAPPFKKMWEKVAKFYRNEKAPRRLTLIPQYGRVVLQVTSDSFPQPLSLTTTPFIANIIVTLSCRSEWTMEELVAEIDFKSEFILSCLDWITFHVPSIIYSDGKISVD